MVKYLIGQFAEAQEHQSIGVDCMDESEILTQADELQRIGNHNLSLHLFTVAALMKKLFVASVRGQLI